MSGEARDIVVTVTTMDIQHWHPGWRAAAAASCAVDFHDWAVAGLRQALQAAARDYVTAHPDLFAEDPYVA